MNAIAIIPPLLGVGLIIIGALGWVILELVLADERCRSVPLQGRPWYWVYSGRLVIAGIAILALYLLLNKSPMLCA